MAERSRLQGFIALALAFAVGTTAAGQQPARQTQPEVQGYLQPSERPDGARLVPPPPRPGSSAWVDDGETWSRLRALQGGPRWSQAQADNDYTTDALLRGFACAVGADLDARRAPATARLLDRAILDAVEPTRAAKEKFKRQRPFVPTDGPICIDRAPLEKSLSYPSGHATTGWAAALLLSQLAPERASEIMGRGRAYGESRVVCGVHWKSDVAAGREVASVSVALLQTNSDFRRDLELARREMAEVRKKAPAPGACPLDTPLD